MTLKISHLAKFKWWYLLIAIIPPIAATTNFLTARVLNGEISVFTLNFLRWLIALICVAPFTFKTLINERAVIFKNFKILSIIALFGVTIFNSLVYYSTQYTCTVNIGVLANIFPIFVLILGHYILHEKITFSSAMAIILCFMGVVSIITKFNIESFKNLLSNKGDFAAILAAFMWAGYVIAVRFKPQALSFKAFFSIVILLGVIYLIPFYLYDYYSGVAGFEYNLKNIVALLTMGIFVAVIGLLAFNFSILKLGATFTSTIFYLCPIFTVIASVLLLHEPLDKYAIIGICLILIGVNITTLTKFLRKKQKP